MLREDNADPRLDSKMGRSRVCGCMNAGRAQTAAKLEKISNANVSAEIDMG